MKEKIKAQEIALESNVGLCGIRIKANLKAESAEKLAAKALPYLLWHDIQSAMHSGGKKAEFDSKSAYSDALGVRAEKDARKVLGEYYEITSFETYAFVKDSPEQKFIKFCLGLGMSEEQAKAGWLTAQANQAKPEVQAEKVLE